MYLKLSTFEISLKINQIDKYIAISHSYLASENF